MQHAAAAPRHSVTDIDTDSTTLTSKVLARRKANRRSMLIAMGLSYLFDAGLFALYAYAGATTYAPPITYGMCCVTTTLVFLVLSETGFNDRFADHYLTIAQGFCSSTIMLGGVYFAPEVGLAFCFVFFLVFGFATLRTTAWQAGILWTYATFGLTVAIVLSDRPLDLPTGSWLERVTTLLFLITSLGRCISMGLFSIAMREALYKRGKELKAAYERIEELAQMDELTGALNRRFVMKELDDELLRCTRGSQACSVALIDLDWFKKINDTFGHPAGDEVLRTFAITIFANIRGIDKFGRYGGEEFLLILPDTAKETATRTLDRLREIIAGLDWAAIAPGLTVSMSAGLTSVRTNDTTDTVLSRADRALYQAKQDGRNRVHVS
jgi:diguanylate cyclase (GGDEF)-like protein